MDISVKLLRKEDLVKNLAAFVNTLKYEDYEYWEQQNFLKELPEKFNLSVLARRENQVAGYIISSKKNDAAYIHKFITIAQFRGQSIGSSMMKYFEDNVRKLGYKYVTLSVITKNHQAIKFYSRFNFKIINTRLDTVNRIELSIMQKLLK